MMQGTLWIAPRGAPPPPFLPCEGWMKLGDIIDASLKSAEVSGNEAIVNMTLKIQGHDVVKKVNDE